MFDSEPYCLDNLPSPNAPPAEKERQWRIWASREIQQRALLAHYILDGLVSQMSGDSTSVRHVANQLGPPSSEAAFEAGTADEWLVHMRSSSNMTTDQRLSFRLVFRQLFSPPGGGSLPLQQHAFSAFSLRVILEGLQSLVSDCDDEEGDAIVAVGVPVRSDVRRALLQVHDNIITMNMHLSTPERLEILLRWHTICLDTVINSSLLCRYICASYNISQHLSPPAGKAMKSGFDLVKWANTEDARMALLHAVAIQDIVEQLPRGRAHVIHMPSSLFAAATVYIVFSLAGVTTVNLPRTIVWQDVLFPKTESGIGLGGLGTSAMDSETKRYIRGERSPSGTPGTTRNLLYELNSMQKLFRCLSSQWGIAHDMEDIVDQWIALCH